MAKLGSMKFKSLSLKGTHKEKMTEWDKQNALSKVFYDPAANQRKKRTDNDTPADQGFRAAMRDNAKAEGKWVTINGRHVFIKEGQSIEEALGKKRKK